MKEFSFSSLFSFIIIPVSLLFTACYQKCNCSDPVPNTTTTGNTTKTLVSDTINYDNTSMYGRVSSLYPTSTYPTLYCLQANVWTTNSQLDTLITRSYFTMNLSILPTDTSLIKSATIILHSNFDSTDPYYQGPSPERETTNNSFYISRVTTPWNPSTLTWYNQPSVSASDFVIIRGNPSANAIYISDVTTMVKHAIANGQSNYGFQIKLLDEITVYNSINIIMGNSKPADRIYAEKLHVTYYK